jgi:AraC-like DNA-binding protein
LKALPNENSLAYPARVAISASVASVLCRSVAECARRVRVMYRMGDSPTSWRNRAEGTTFGAFVKEARLRRIRRDLADPSLAQRTIADIARRHGYRHPAALTRAFAQRYGSGPRAFRQAR